MKQFKEAEAALVVLKPMVAKKSYEQEVAYLLAESKRALGDLKGSVIEYEIAARQTQGEVAGEALYRLGFVRFQLKLYDKSTVDFDEYRTNYKEGAHYQQAGVYLGRYRRWWVEPF